MSEVLLYRVSQVDFRVSKVDFRIGSKLEERLGLGGTETLEPLLHQPLGHPIVQSRLLGV